MNKKISSGLMAFSVILIITGAYLLNDSISAISTANQTIETKRKDIAVQREKISGARKILADEDKMQTYLYVESLPEGAASDEDQKIHDNYANALQDVSEATSAIQEDESDIAEAKVLIEEKISALTWNFVVLCLGVVLFGFGAGTLLNQDNERY